LPITAVMDSEPLLYDVELGAVLGLQDAGDEVRRAAGAGGGPVEALALPGGGDEFLEVVVGRVGRHQDHRGRQADHRDRRQVGVLVGQRLLDHAVGDDPGRADEEGVAIGLALRHHGRAQAGRAAGLVLDHDRLAQALGGALGGRAGHQVVGAAGRERHDEADRLGRPGIALGEGGQGGGGGRAGQGGEGGAAEDAVGHWKVLALKL
jgi:hypothetical protein